MNHNVFKKSIICLGLVLLGCSLISCTKANSTENPSKSGYEGGVGDFGGDGGHKHKNK